MATPFKIKGGNYSITSACATSTHCIGNAAELIQFGKQDIVFAGGSEELDWTMTLLFDAMPAFPLDITIHRKQRAVLMTSTETVSIAGGEGVVILEELERTLARGAKIYAEVVGYAATSDGHDMVQPSSEGAVRCMRLALAGPMIQSPISTLTALVRRSGISVN